MINFFRSEAQAGRSAVAALSGGARPWDSDTYFQPVLPDDELLFHDWEEEEEGAEGPAGARYRTKGRCHCKAARLGSTVINPLLLHSSIPSFMKFAIGVATLALPFISPSCLKLVATSSHFPARS